MLISKLYVDVVYVLCKVCFGHVMKMALKAFEESLMRFCRVSCLLKSNLWTVNTKTSKNVTTIQAV